MQRRQPNAQMRVDEAGGGQVVGTVCHLHVGIGGNGVRFRTHGPDHPVASGDGGLFHHLGLAIVG